MTIGLTKSDIAERISRIEWISVPEFAERLGTSAANVRGALQARRIVGRKHSHQVGALIPDIFLVPRHLSNPADPGPAPAAGEPEQLVILPALRGTITVLADHGFSDDEILDWLLTDHDELGESPVSALLRGHTSAVRRVAQVLD
ncbi:Rv2175c family DNA-binding protein [Rarobacter incanus]|uniref:Rv2175c C-terminal domain-containing protein n=1 Tax=Rarobacter incanus TaxID=153494 RepID=A0A542SMD7_9MICO|nr:Rv2175c family DNA-binding protein [Rarobacter incanus]TQK75794.1 hypothetical protein FB389_0429 [Rarobacter incanus]